MDYIVSQVNELFAVELLRILREYITEIPDHHNFYGYGSFHIIYLTDILLCALNHGMFNFILEYSDLFTPITEFKQTAWIWFKEQSEENINNVPKSIQKVVTSYEKSELWNDNKYVALVVVRRLRERSDNDLISYISSILHNSLDVKEVKTAIYFRRHSEYCRVCEGYYLIGECYCRDFSGYIP